VDVPVWPFKLIIDIINAVYEYSTIGTKKIYVGS